MGGRLGMVDTLLLSKLGWRPPALLPPAGNPLRPKDGPVSLCSSSVSALKSSDKSGKSKSSVCMYIIMLKKKDNIIMPHDSEIKRRYYIIS